jgi:hypothetical protein
VDPHPNLQVMPLRRHFIDPNKIFSLQWGVGDLKWELYRYGPTSTESTRIAEELMNRARKMNTHTSLFCIISHLFI